LETPVFRLVDTDRGTGVTYTCGCPCVPAAVPSEAGPGFEHCCCGKVHFAGAGAARSLDAYLAERKATRKREPEYASGEALIELGGRAVEVAWAFPVEAD